MQETSTVPAVVSEQKIAGQYMTIKLVLWL